MSGSDVGYHLGYEERVVFRAAGFVFGVITSLFLKSVQTTDAGGKDHAHTVLVYVFAGYAGIFHSLVGCYQGIHGVEVELTCFFAVKVVCRIEVLYFAGKLCFEQRSVKMCDRAGSAFAFEGVLPCLGSIVAYGSEGAETGHHYSF